MAELSHPASTTREYDSVEILLSCQYIDVLTMALSMAIAGIDSYIKQIHYTNSVTVQSNPTRAK